MVVSTKDDMKKEMSIFGEKVVRKNSAIARELHDLYDWWYFRAPIEPIEIEVAPDNALYE